MRELSLNILDIAQNSVKAGAKLISVAISADSGKDSLYISITDDGCGMDGETLNKAADPFFTDRTTRKIGMGIPLFKQAAEMTGGRFSINSEKGGGTHITASLRLSSINRMPMGDLAETVITLLLGAEHYDLEFNYSVDGREFFISSAELKKTVEFKDFSAYEVLEFLRGYLTEHIDATNGGLII